MAPFPFGKTSTDSVGYQSFAELMQELDAGWQIGPPVYVMVNPVQKNKTVFRMVLWRDGRPRVVSVPDGPDIRQYLLDCHLSQESL
jgi:hypothetical protein